MCRLMARSLGKHRRRRSDQTRSNRRALRWRNTLPPNIITPRPVITTPPPIITIRLSTIMRWASTKRRSITRRRPKNIASLPINIPRLRTRTLTSDGRLSVGAEASARPIFRSQPLTRRTKGAPSSGRWLDRQRAKKSHKLRPCGQVSCQVRRETILTSNLRVFALHHHFGRSR